jgi:transketolase
MGRLDVYEAVARQLRADSIRCSTAAGSGHPTSSLSAAELIAVLLVGNLRYDWSDPKNLVNDHLIFSKGPRLPARLRALPRRERDHRPGAHVVP